MKIITAEHAGFCFGVQRAVEKAEELAKESGSLTEQPAERGRIYTYGPLIHNASVIADLEKKGVYAVDATEPVDTSDEHETDTILIRAHGVSPRVEDSLKSSYGRVVDATCPFVKKIHRIVADHAAAGEQIVITGSPVHPEVIGIGGCVENGDFYVISDENEAAEIALDPSRPVCVVSQTTFHYNKFQYLVEILGQKGYDIRAFNTICNATEERQKEAAEIAAVVDVMLVIGGENSSNSIKLFEICRKICPLTYFLQSADDLDLQTLLSVDSIGITAGASTPHYIIEEVQKKCQK